MVINEVVVKLLVVLGLLLVHAVAYGAARVGTYCLRAQVPYSSLVAFCRDDPAKAALSIAHVRWSPIDIAVNTVMIVLWLGIITRL